jgi:SAM-dependent methyltransferase
MEPEEYERMYLLEREHWWYVTTHALIEHYIRNTDDGAPRRLLDVGCGTGRLVQILQKYGAAEGFDYSEAAISFCKKRGLANVWRQDLNDWKPTPNSYDLIVSVDVLCERAVRDDIGEIQKFYQALKSGGTLILHLPAFQFLRRGHDEVVWAVRRYSKNQMKVPLEKLGFRVQVFSYRLFPLFFVISFRKMLEKRRASGTPQSDLGNVNPLLNAYLKLHGRFDNWLVRHASGLVPVGSSLLIVART